MKKIIFAFALVACFVCTSCYPECQPVACQVPIVLPGQYTCQAIQQGWFYNNSTGECEFIMYTGCAPAEYSTQEACESFCICE